MDLAAVSLAMLHPTVLGWQTGQLARLADAHQGDLELATSLEIARMRAEHFSLPGAEAEHYLNRWQPVSADLTALLSIRFEGMDRHKPFVDLSGLSRPWTTADLPALAAAALEVYGRFAPRYLRLTSPLAPDALPGLGRDYRFLTAPLAELAVAPALPPELSLRHTMDDRHYTEAMAAYSAVEAEHAAHPEQARLLSRDDLAECIGAGLMYDVWAADRWVGYVGVLPEEHLGLAVYTIQELLLTPEARGRGFGAALTTLLARALLKEAEPNRVLFGTIHADNAGAYAAARRAGRLDVGGQVQLALPVS